MLGQDFEVYVKLKCCLLVVVFKLLLGREYEDGLIKIRLRTCDMT